MPRIRNRQPTYTPVPEIITSGQQMWQGMSPLEKSALVSSPVPFVGDALGLLADAEMYATEPESRTWGNVALSAAGLLPLVPAASLASRMGRASDQNFNIDAYHGSTYDIDAFDVSRANPESDWGAGIYSSSSPKDASLNYSDLTGQDLDLRIEVMADQLSMDMDEGTAYELAKSRLYGGAPNVMPLRLRMNKPFEIGDNPSYLTMERPELDPLDYLSEADGDIDLARDLAYEAAYDFEPEGDLADFIESVANNPSINDEGRGLLVASLYEAATDGEVSANEINRIMRETEFYTEGDAGEYLNREVFRGALADAGFDGVIDRTVYDKFGHGSGRMNYMDGIYPDTAHYVVFEPQQARSINAMFDPAKQNSSDLLASIAAGGIGIGALAQLMQEEEDTL